MIFHYFLAEYIQILLVSILSGSNRLGDPGAFRPWDASGCWRGGGGRGFVFSAVAWSKASWHLGLETYPISCKYRIDSYCLFHGFSSHEAFLDVKQHGVQRTSEKHAALNGCGLNLQNVEIDIEIQNVDIECFDRKSRFLRQTRANHIKTLHINPLRQSILQIRWLQFSRLFTHPKPLASDKGLMFPQCS